MENGESWVKHKGKCRMRLKVKRTWADAMPIFGLLLAALSVLTSQQYERRFLQKPPIVRQLEAVTKAKNNLESVVTDIPLSETETSKLKIAYENLQDSINEMEKSKSVLDYNTAVKSEGVVGAIGFIGGCCIFGAGAIARKLLRQRAEDLYAKEMCPPLYPPRS